MTHSDVRDGQRPASEVQQSVVRRGRKLDTWGWFALVLGSVLVASGLLEAVRVRAHAGGRTTRISGKIRGREGALRVRLSGVRCGKERG